MEILTNLLAAISQAIAMLILAVGSLLGVALQTPPALPQEADVATTTETFPVAQEASSTPLQTETEAVVAAEVPAEPLADEEEVTESEVTPQQLADANAQARAALVNILCTTKSGGAFKPLSGSGIMVDGRGIILTNAHIGQYFLLRDYPTEGNVQCIIRTGSPAQARYKAELLYIPTPWIEKNASQVNVSGATGTGENDFAFLYVTGAVEDGSLPASFPHVSPDSTEPDIGDSTLLAAYPAGFLSGEVISTNLHIASSFAYVTRLFTYDEKRDVDLFSIGGTVVSQSGSSGGAVVRSEDATLAGIIVTATAGESTGERDLRAISLLHIDKSLAEQGKKGLSEFLALDPKLEAEAFAKTTAPELTDILEDELRSR